MPEFSAMYIRQRKYLFFFLAVCILGWGFTPYQTIFLGLAFGTTISIINLRLLVKKVDKFGEMASQGGKLRSLGLGYRMLTSIIAVIIAMEFTEYFHVISVVIGLMTAYIVIMIDYFFQIFH